MTGLWQVLTSLWAWKVSRLFEKQAPGSRSIREGARASVTTLLLGQIDALWVPTYWKIWISHCYCFCNRGMQQLNYGHSISSQWPFKMRMRVKLMYALNLIPRLLYFSAPVSLQGPCREGPWEWSCYSLQYALVNSFALNICFLFRLYKLWNKFLLHFFQL